MDFLDVPGASGTQYRFRRATVATLPVTAGNVVVVAGTAARRRFLLCGTSRGLNRAAPALEVALRGARGAQLFIRLNVNSAVRDAEHADIVGAVRPEVEQPHLDEAPPPVSGQGAAGR